MAPDLFEKGRLPADVEAEDLDVRYVDEAYETWQAHRDEAVDPAESRRALRIVDRHLLPFMCGLYFLQYLDKQGLNFSSLYGIQTDLHLVGSDYSWLSSIFYFGYMVAQPFFGYVAQRFPIAKVLGFCIMAWATILITTPACTNFAGAAANRFLLGVFEAGVTPGFILITSIWWLAAEHPLRTEIYYCFNGFATIVGGLIGYGVGHANGALPKWMYIYLILGSITIAFGIAFLIFMPDRPTSARFLSEHDKVVVVKRVASNKIGVENKHFKKGQVWQAAKDPKTWILIVMGVAAQIPNAALTSFGSLIVSGFGFSTLQTQLMQIPGGVVQIVSLLLGGWVSSRFKDMRCITMLVGNGICILGAGLLVGLPDSNQWGRLVAFWLLSCQSVGFTIAMTIIASNIAGYTKKQVTGAALFIAYSVGNIAGPQLFISTEKPTYPTAYKGLLIGYTIKFLMVVVLYVYMWWENRRRDRLGLEGDEIDQKAILLGLKDITELENPGFRYHL